MSFKASSNGSSETENAAQALDFFGTLRETEEAPSQISKDHELKRNVKNVPLLDVDKIKAKHRKLEDTLEIGRKRKKRRKDTSQGEVMSYILSLFSSTGKIM